MNYLNQKIRQTLELDIQKRWTAVSTLLGLISCVYRELPTGDWTNDLRMQSRNSTIDHQPTSHTSDAKLTSYDNCAAN